MSHVTHLNESCLTRANVPASCVSESFHWLIYDRGEGDFCEVVTQVASSSFPREFTLYLCDMTPSPLPPCSPSCHPAFHPRKILGYYPSQPQKQEFLLSPAALVPGNKITDSHTSAHNHTHILIVHFCPVGTFEWDCLGRNICERRRERSSGD